MPRLIDADALKDIMCASVCGLVQPLLCTCGCAQILAVDNAPTIEAEPVRHGHWEVVDEQEPRRYGCSGCLCLSWCMSNYCPYCGAKMDEVDK